MVGYIVPYNLEHIRADFCAAIGWTIAEPLLADDSLAGGTVKWTFLTVGQQLANN